MKKVNAIKKLSTLIFAGLGLISAQTLAKDSHFETDFDHKVQYKLTKLASKQYQLEVARLGNTNFARMNLFATRKAKKLCIDMGYSITYLDGVEGFDDRKQMPNYIFPSLTVEINCS